MITILFVCLGNICRSPAAEGILRHLINQEVALKNVKVQSCGLGSWHVGQLPDACMRQVASKRGIYLTSPAQAFHPKFLEDFDYIFAADQEILHHLYLRAKTVKQKVKIHLLTAFSQIYHHQNIPAPFYKRETAFDEVLDMIEEACKGFIEHLKTRNKHAEASA
ncbi:putative low molecular weight protein-tyrosine-phosphatase [Neochlamydia sp. TUME1]|uniref:low molecular weight protein-tyrosine-phosphatase n=1 Tax=Neochlamydia sp. TUME1 TaxID=1478174 RepID=UPI00057D9559|nr:low molecular weight protein-tyrosine-phosphatase [Neochlamydia sp. TUME1]KIC76105.1 putative low molecular weight protein-tyrosine-phosphatase [Neochlamydia sp. TUME1]